MYVDVNTGIHIIHTITFILLLLARKSFSFKKTPLGTKTTRKGTHRCHGKIPRIQSEFKFPTKKQWCPPSNSPHVTCPFHLMITKFKNNYRSLHTRCIQVAKVLPFYHSTIYNIYTSKKYTVGSTPLKIRNTFTTQLFVCECVRMFDSVLLVAGSTESLQVLLYV